MAPRVARASGRGCDPSALSCAIVDVLVGVNDPREQNRHRPHLRQRQVLPAHRDGRPRRRIRREHERILQGRREIRERRFTAREKANTSPARTNCVANSSPRPRCPRPHQSKSCEACESLLQDRPALLCSAGRPGRSSPRRAETRRRRPPLHIAQTMPARPEPRRPRRFERQPARHDAHLKNRNDSPAT